MHTHSYICKRTFTHTHAHTHHLQTHFYTHTHTHTHTHTRRGMHAVQVGELLSQLPPDMQVETAVAKAVGVEAPN